MSVTEPGKILTPWAEFGLKNSIPLTANPVTGRAGFDQGFSAINMTAREAGGIPPFGQDFNGIFYEVTSILRYMQAGGRPTFDAEFADKIGGYPKGATILGSDGSSVFSSTIDNNLSNPNTGGAGWVMQKLYESLTPQKFMTTEQFNDWLSGAGLVDQTSALNAFWQAIKASFVDLPSEDYVKLAGTIPPGEYRVDGYVNWTGLKARNTQILAYGAVFVGRGQLGAIVDLVGSRWVQAHGLTIVGDENNMPLCGVLLGPEGTVTSGNNMFVGVTVTGHFSKTAVWNIGSETTTYFRSRFVNYNTDKTAYAYIADGKMRNGATSQYQPLRASGVAVSFTNNQFYSCDIRNMGGGSPVWAEFTRGWGFDRGCYFISFDDAIFKLYTTSDSTHQNLSIEGLMESVTLPNFPLPGYIGCRHQIEFIGNGTSSVFKGLTFKVGVPHTALSSIKISTAGPVTVHGADISIGGQLTPGVPVFDAPGLSIIGSIQAENGSELNINQIAKFDGNIIVAIGTLNRPVAGVYTMINSQSGQLILGGSGPRTFDGVYRTDGVADDVDARLRAKGVGNVVLGSEGTKLDAFTVVIPDGAVHSIDAVNVTTGTPYIAPRSSVAVVNMGVKSKGAGSRVQLSNDVATDSFVEALPTSTHPTLRAAGVNTDIDLVLAGKGSGNVRFGSLTANADAPVTGYITIKDAGGTIRKLAVIS